MSIPIPAKRIATFEKKAYGMFIHYGLYSQLACGEKTMDFNNIPLDEYVKLKDTFTAKSFDAKKIARFAKASGMKYITLTARHHDGFSLYDTKGLCDYDAVHSPAGRDLIREFVGACNEEGIMPMLYHTTIDWYQSSYRDNFESYLQYLRDSVEILCTSYGRIGGFWFDGNWDRPNADWQEDQLYGLIRKYQPDAMIINNTGVDALGRAGHPELDSVTYELGRPKPMKRDGAPKYLAAEMCNTLNDHWGYAPEDFNYKSVAQMIETLCGCRKVGANYLLNISPMGDGSIVPLQANMIESIGEWIKKCGKCIYDGKPSEIVGEDKNFALECHGKLYLFIFSLKTFIENRKSKYEYFQKLPGAVKQIKWTDNGENVEFVQRDEHLWINATPFPYGKSYVVRVAEVELE